MSKFKKKFGFAFPEFVQVGKRRKNPPGLTELRVAESWEAKSAFSPKSEKPFQVSVWRVAAVYFVFISGFLVLAARSFDLQVIQGGIFLGRSEGNHLSIQVDHAPRGVIYDRNGKILASNIPGYRLLLEPQSLSSSQRSEVIGRLAAILGLPASSIGEKLKGGGEQVTLVENLAPDKALVIDAESEKLPGVKLEVNPIRYYPYKEFAANILGYTAEADKEDLAKKLVVPYSLGDKVGRAGVESAQEDILRGANGFTLSKVTAAGKKVGEIYKTSPAPGGSVTLSIDIDLQQFVYQALQKEIAGAGAKKASAVVLDPFSGEVLAMVSLPSFDDNLFAAGLTTQDYQRLISNPDNPLINRTVEAAYPPGSTFKMVTAAAGLETGAIGPQTKLVDRGFVTVNGQVFNNWLWNEQRKTEGSLDVVRALVRSTDTFFYQVSQMVGEKVLAGVAESFGLGQKTGIELPGEAAGLIPTNEWKLATKGEPWYPGDTLNMSIGQGDVLVSPLQLSLVTATFANGGKLVKPTILKTSQPSVVRENFLKKETIATVNDGLYQAASGSGGLTWIFGGFKIPSAGKTGTAESGQEKAHAWYTAFAPYPNAKIVATVMVEQVGHGSEVSAPVVKQIFEWWFTRH